MTARNIIRHIGLVSSEMRETLVGHKSFVLWFTGLSGSGKSTLAHTLESRLIENGNHAYVLDGDNIRHGINSDLGFSPEDRMENIRRIGEISRLFVDAGLIILSAFISPYKRDRQQVRSLFPQGRFIEVYLECSVSDCENRDTKGLYKKARNGEVPEFTGISAPYEAPENPEITVDTRQMSVDESVQVIYQYLRKKNLIK